MKQGISLFLNWLFALVFSAIGLVNCFVGNDPEFGIFILFSSLLFYPPFRLVFQKKTGWMISPVVLIVLGELLEKINMILG